MKVSNLWHEGLPPDTTLEVYRKLALMHVDRIHDPAHRHALRNAVKRRQWLAVCNYEVPLSGSVSVADLINIRQVLAFFQKLESLDVGIDKERAAYDKFVESERLCRDTNDFFRPLNVGGRANYSLQPRLAMVLYHAQKKIQRVLGKRPPSAADIRFRFGPGATTTVKKVEACPTNKMAAGLGCGRRMLHSLVLRNILREVPHWTAEFATGYSVDDEGFLVEWVEVTEEVARLAFVPKNFKTHRAVVTEPTLNGFAQLGYGDWMARRLKKFGVDLKDQSVNAWLAREGSISGQLSTIDLSSASDTIARELVKFLLPYEWYALLDALRSDVVQYGSGDTAETFTLEKFSSMGNGFTFPLESLIFWALVSSVKPDGLCSVYGDDIICEQSAYDEVVWVLEACGFKVNSAKSFHSGPFRESCGHDYYLGIETRPCYLKDDASARVLYRLHNFHVSELDDEMAKAVLSFLPRDGRLWGPNAYGDGHLHDPWYWNRAQPTSKKLLAKGYCGATFETYRLKPPRSKAWRYPGDHLTPLYVCYLAGRTALLTEDQFPADAQKYDEYDWTPNEVVESREVRKDKNFYPLWDTPGHEGSQVVSIYAFRR